MIIIIYLNTKQSLQAQPGSMSQHVESEAQWRIEQVNTRGIYFSKTSHYLINRELIDPYIKLQAKMYATKLEDDMHTVELMITVRYRKVLKQHWPWWEERASKKL